jgi:competence protein ComEC
LQDARKHGWALALGPAGWVVGTAIQVGQPALWSTGAYVALAGLSGALLLATWLVHRKISKVSLTALALLSSAALLAFALAGLRAQVRAADRIAPELEGRDLLVTGVIDRTPERGADGWRFPFAVRQARVLDAMGNSGDAVRLPARALVTWYAHGYRHEGADETGHGAADAGLAPPAPPLAGERWRFALRLKAPHGNRNPYGFDAELWLWEQGVGATGYVRTGAKTGSVTPQLLAAASGHWIERARQWTRDRILANATAGDAARQRQAGIVAALVTGDQAAIAPQDWTLFRMAGVAHLVIISGLHITMIGWLASIALGWLWRLGARHALPRRRNPALWLPAPVASRIGGFACALLYALFSGWGVPAQRTALMLGMVTLLRLAGLAWPWWLTWLWAMAAVLAADPWALMQPGFWLSFVAVGILFATDQGAHDAGGASGPIAGAAGVGRRLWRHGKALLRDQGIVTIALTPLTLLLFHQASLVGLLSNLVGIPWIMLVVTPLALLGALAHPLWQVAMWALWPLLAWLQWLSSWPMAALTWPAVPWPAGAAAVAGGVLLALRWPWALRLAGVPLLACLALWTPDRPPEGQFELLAVDIGQGSATLIRTARHALLFDAGPRYSATSDAGSRELVPLLTALGVRLDGVMLSHRDIDHVGGAAAVLQAQPRAWLMESETEPPQGVTGHIPLRCQAGQAWDWDGVHLQVLHPPASRYAETTNTNARSCLLRVSAQEGRGAAALMTGDIQARQERELVLDASASGLDLHADVLMAPHHGSHTSSSPEFIAAVHPRFTLAQAGYRNRYHLPNPKIVARYHAAGVNFIATPACGAARWESTRSGHVHCERVENAHYWQHEVPEP